MSFAKHSLPPKCIDDGYSYNNNNNNNKTNNNNNKKKKNDVDNVGKDDEDDSDDDDEVYKCMFAANTLPYMPVPAFILQSRYDSW